MKYNFFGIQILNLPQYGPEQIIVHYAHVAASLNETPLSVTQKDNIPMTANNKEFPKKHDCWIHNPSAILHCCS